MLETLAAAVAAREPAGCWRAPFAAAGKSAERPARELLALAVRMVSLERRETQVGQQCWERREAGRTALAELKGTWEMPAE